MHRVKNPAMDPATKCTVEVFLGSAMSGDFEHNFEYNFDRQMKALLCIM